MPSMMYLDKVGVVEGLRSLGIDGHCSKPLLKARYLVVVVECSASEAVGSGAKQTFVTGDPT